jgi:hypothetical protein
VIIRFPLAEMIRPKAVESMFVVIPSVRELGFEL